MTVVPIRVHRFAGFDDPALEAMWARASRLAPTAVFMTLGWQRAWWRSHGHGELLLLGAEDESGAALLAPLLFDGGMLFLVGSGGSDRLDLVGDPRPDLVTSVLAAAMREVSPILGIRLYHVPHDSRTLVALGASATIGLEPVDEGSLAAPMLDLVTDGAAALAKQSLRRHERGLAREGRLRFLDQRTFTDVEPWLPAFFDQHTARSAERGVRSPLEAEGPHRAFVREAAIEGERGGWLRFTVVEWRGEPVAIHFGTCHAGTFLWYLPTFDTRLARRSPGEVLLAGVIRTALGDGAAWLDLGIGDEPYKARFTSIDRSVRTVGLYPRDAVAAA